MNKYFISFANAQGSLGVVVTEAPTPDIALTRISDLGINPGGEAKLWQIGNNEARDLGLDMLITPDQLNAKGYVSTHKVHPILRSIFTDDALHVCETCNRDHFSGGLNSHSHRH